MPGPTDGGALEVAAKTLIKMWPIDGGKHTGKVATKCSIGKLNCGM